LELTVRMPVIGVVRASHHELETTPIQAGFVATTYALVPRKTLSAAPLSGPAGHRRSLQFSETR
jgi:hypothetical protein